MKRKGQGRTGTDSIAADGGEDVVVASVDEVEGDGIEGPLPLVHAVADLVLPLPRRRQRPHRRLAPQPALRHPCLRSLSLSLSDGRVGPVLTRTLTRPAR